MRLAKPMTLEELNERLASALGSKYELVLKPARLEVRRDPLRGCVVKLREKKGTTEVLVGPFVPSLPLIVVMSIICVGGAAALAFFVNPIVGAAVFVLSVVARLLPSVGIVNEVKRAVARASDQAFPQTNQPDQARPKGEVQFQSYTR